MNTHSTLTSAGVRLAGLRTTVIWFAGAALAAPFGVILHELGHFLTARIFQFEGASLHYE